MELETSDVTWSNFDETSVPVNAFSFPSHIILWVLTSKSGGTYGLLYFMSHGSLYYNVHEVKHQVVLLITIHDFGQENKSAEESED